MTPSQAILTGSAIVAASIVGAALVLPQGDAIFGKRATVADAPARQAAPRYQIVKADNGTTWRLDTRTGDITVCRLERERMVCASSTDAVVLPKVSAEELKKQQAERQAAKKAERNEMLDKFMAFFERIIRLGREQTKNEKSAPPDDGNALRL